MKTLNTTPLNPTRTMVDDLVEFGKPDQWKVICKALSESEGWMKSTKALEISGVGCIVQVTTQQGGQVAEALTFVPGVKIIAAGNGGYCLEDRRM